MEWFHNLFFGNSSFWGGGVAHSVLILALVIALGIALGKLKIGGIRLGVTWILFVGIAFSHFGMQLNEHLVHFVKEFGLILFVYSIGLQVGPSFFSSFKKGGVKLNMLATAIVFLGVIAAYIVHLATGLHITTVVGILSGAVTNTPGLGAAQQAYADMTGIDAPDIATGYAVAYPLGVIGIILSMLFIRWIFRIRFDEENKILSSREDNSREAVRASVEVKNQFLDGKTVLQIKRLINRQFVISRVLRPDGHIEIANAQTPLRVGDKVMVVTTADNAELVEDFLGEKIDMEMQEWEKLDNQLITRRIMITKSKLNGKYIGELKLRSGYGVNMTRVNRAGVDLIPNHNLQLQMGDRVTVVGSEAAINAVSKILGNSMRRLNEPNLIPIFVGIVLGVLLGSIPIAFPGIPAARQARAGRRPAGRIDPDQPVRPALQAGYLYDDEREPDAPRNRHRTVPGLRRTRRRRRIRPYGAVRERIPLDRLRLPDYGSPAADRRYRRAQILQAELLYADGTVRRIDDRSPGAGVLERDGRQRHAFGRLCDRLSAHDVSADSDGPDADTLRGIGAGREVFALQKSPCIR